jgi:hypothetical protein
MKCPNCNSENFIELKNPQGYSYVLTTVDLSKTPPDFKPDIGLPINLQACQKCGFTFIFRHQK